MGKQIAAEETWRVFRIMAEFVEAFETMSRIAPAVSVFGSARAQVDYRYYTMAEQMGRGYPGVFRDDGLVLPWFIYLRRTGRFRPSSSSGQEPARTRARVRRARGPGICGVVVLDIAV